ncbi:MAG: peptidylprolyl isomerase [Proteobacteria bacterium]|nr:peptidylprolyl isomerase [Pseudomonadota bacterium]
MRAAHINGVALHGDAEVLDEAALRQRACTELLRQQAQRAGLLDSTDTPQDGMPSEAAVAAIDRLLEAALALPEPDEAACRRHHAAHAARYRQGERVQARHILLAVTPGTPLAPLRQRAEALLLEVRAEPALFAERAAALSNCPSGEAGGQLGWLTAAEVAPEFGRELFGHPEVGVLPRLVHSRFGLHVVEVLARDVGEDQPFEAVQGAVRQALQQQVFATALRQYLQQLAGQAQVVGVALEAADTPLVQ